METLYSRFEKPHFKQLKGTFGQKVSLRRRERKEKKPLPPSLHADYKATPVLLPIGIAACRGRET